MEKLFDRILKREVKKGKKVEKKHKVRPVPEVISPDLIYELSFKLTRMRDRILYYIMWLSNCRISEALNIRPMDLSFTSEGNKTFYWFDLINLKSRIQTTKRVPVRYDLNREKDIPDLKWNRIKKCREVDRKMIHLIEDYVANNELPDDQRIFPKVLNSKGKDITRHNYYNRLKYNLRTRVRMIKQTPEGRKVLDDQEFRLNPHYLRHARGTWLYVNTGMKEQHMVLIMGWSDPRPMKNYMHLKIGDLLEVL